MITAARSFWRSCVLAFALGLFSFNAQSGYSANVTQSSNTAYFPLRGFGACYLTVGMAVTSVAGNGVYVDSIDASGFTWHGTYGASSPINASGSFISCTATANGGTQPAMSAAVSDPGLSAGGGISTGSGSGSSGVLTINVPELQWDAETFDIAVGGSLLIFVTGFGVGLVINIVRRLRTP